MPWAALCALSLLGAVRAAVQVPLSTSTAGDGLRVNLTEANFIFNGLEGLLQQLPNNAHPNGHVVVPAVISAYTPLYHARIEASGPPSPEWLAFDAEMSYAILTSWRQPIHLFTYSATRDLRVLYFDGQSAALGGNGWLDAQEVLVNRRGAPVLRKYGWWDDYERLWDLCDWAETLSIDGFIRMNVGFEVMWCDFDTGLELVSVVNITAPDLSPPRWKWPPRRPGRRRPTTTALQHALSEGFTDDQADELWDDLLDEPGEDRPAPPQAPTNGTRRPFPGWAPRAPLTMASGYEWLRIATQRYLDPQPGVRLITSALVSFYDAASFPSLASARARAHQTNMRQTRVWANISDADAVHAVACVEAVLRRPDLWTRGGVDWVAKARRVTATWGPRLAQMNASLARLPDEPFNATGAVEAARLVAYTLLNPYLDTAALANTSRSDPALWLPPTLERCSAAPTAHIPPSAHLTYEEHLLRASIEAVVQRLCTFAGSVLAHSFGPGKETDPVLAGRWRADLGSLMDWLDWAMWIRCDEECGWERLCLIPIWPAFGPVPPPWEKDLPAEKPKASCVPFEGWIHGNMGRF